MPDTTWNPWTTGEWRPGEVFIYGNPVLDPMLQQLAGGFPTERPNQGMGQDVTNPWARLIFQAWNPERWGSPAFGNEWTPPGWTQQQPVDLRGWAQLGSAMALGEAQQQHVLPTFPLEGENAAAQFAGQLQNIMKMLTPRTSLYAPLWQSYGWGLPGQ